MSAADHEFEDEDRPWESPGAVRRDCAPHRAHLVKLLSAFSQACAVLAICIGAPAVPGLALAIIAWRMAETDLRKMATGLMDPEGRLATLVARQSAILSIGLNFILGGAWLGIFLHFQ